MTIDLRAKWRKAQGRFVTRLVAGMLLVSVPPTVVVAVLLTREASRSLTSSGLASSNLLARAVALHVEDFVAQRVANLTVVASDVSQRSGGAGVAAAGGTERTYGDDSTVEVTDLTGRIVAGSRTGGTFDASGEPWFRTAASGQTVVRSPVEEGGDIQWFIAVPVLDQSGRPIGVVVEDLDVEVLPRLLGAELSAQGAEIVVADRNRRLIYDTTMGSITGPELLANGGLRSTVDNAAVAGALAGGSGSTLLGDRAHRVVAGFDRVDSLGWAVVAQQRGSGVLAPVRRGRNLAIGLTLAGAVLAVGFSVMFSRWTTRPVAVLANAGKELAGGNLTLRLQPTGAAELRDMAEIFNESMDGLVLLLDQLHSASADVNAAATDLSASSEELAATTTEQSAAVTEVSATAEELARASGSIADTVDGVAAQAAETRDNLEQAEADITASSERTLALADRVGQIGAILALINDIADQTNLLALNAAIEAARAGDSGRGFAVVAEEVRRLAERSKTSAAEIATIVEGANAETAATVMAMEKGASQMHRGLRLLEGVSDATAQVRLTTQQQHSATSQVVETMEQLNQASRQVSGTAQQIAAAAAKLAGLSAELKVMASGRVGKPT